MSVSQIDWAGVVVGAVLSAVASVPIAISVSGRFYRKSSKELGMAAKEIIRRSDMILRSLAEAGIVEVNRDETGRITGIVIHGRAQVHATATTSAKAVVRHPDGTED